MADETKGAIVLQGENGNECIRGSKYYRNAQTAHVIGRDSIVVQLAQPFMLNSLRLVRQKVTDKITNII